MTTEIAVQHTSVTGIYPTYQEFTVNGTFCFRNDGEIFLRMRAVGGTATITTHIKETVEGTAVGSYDFTITDGRAFYTDYYPTRWYNDHNGMVQFTYSITAGTLYVAALTHAPS
jgi:hypothetical protein